MNRSPSLGCPDCTTPHGDFEEQRAEEKPAQGKRRPGKGATRGPLPGGGWWSWWDVVLSCLPTARWKARSPDSQSMPSSCMAKGQRPRRRPGQGKRKKHQGITSRTHRKPTRLPPKPGPKPTLPPRYDTRALQAPLLHEPPCSIRELPDEGPCGSVTACDE